MTTEPHAGLPPDLAFEPDGHLTELCLTCVSDGELALVPEGALAHLDGCEPCARRLGEAALLSVAAGEALREAALAPAPIAAVAVVAPAPVTLRRARRPLPIMAIAAALLVAAVTAVPTLVAAAGELPGAIAGTIRLVLLSARFGSTLLRASSSGLGPLLARCATAVVLVVLGLQVARVRSRARSWQGGVQ